MMIFHTYASLPEGKTCTTTDGIWLAVLCVHFPFVYSWVIQDGNCFPIGSRLILEYALILPDPWNSYFCREHNKPCLNEAGNATSRRKYWISSEDNMILLNHVPFGYLT